LHGGRRTRGRAFRDHPLDGVPARRRRRAGAHRARGRLMRILIATDAWHPQINGVVRTLNALEQAGSHLGAQFRFITPGDFPTVPLLGYPEIPMALPNPRTVARLIADAKADAIHISTEAPVGYFVRRYCLANHLPFTT